MPVVILNKLKRTALLLNEKFNTKIPLDKKKKELIILINKEVKQISKSDLAKLPLSALTVLSTIETNDKAITKKKEETKKCFGKFDNLLANCTMCPILNNCKTTTNKAKAEMEKKHKEAVKLVKQLPILEASIKESKEKIKIAKKMIKLLEKTPAEKLHTLELIEL